VEVSKVTNIEHWEGIF